MGRERGTADSRKASDIGDHLMYLGATHPEWFAPYRDRAATELSTRLPMDPATAATLLPGLGGAALDQLCERVEANPKDAIALSMLAATAAPRALTVIADVTRRSSTSAATDALGVHVGSSGPAVLRFAPARYAITLPGAVGQARCPLGLSLDQVTNDAESITWHYLSVPPAPIDGAPFWPHELVHIVAPRTYWFTMKCNVLSDGRYTNATVDDGGEPFDLHLSETEADPPQPAMATLRRYDEELVYRNGHVLATPGVIGTAGGPPIGLYPSPRCPQCDLLMFHVATIDSGAREYGDGFRSAFICETCQTAGVTGTNWN